jgi:hypothetical protein
MKTNLTYYFTEVCRLLKGKLLLSCLLLLPSFGAFAQDIPAIKKVFNDFQSGYNKRDTTMTESFGNRLFARDIFILGTGSEEWISGLSAAKKLVKNDWAYWLNLSIDTTQLNLQKAGSVYLFAAKGTAYIQFPNKEVAYSYGMGQLNSLLKNETDSRLKLLALAKESSSLINEIEKGDLNIRYQIRLSGVLVRQDNKWVFQQLIYSFPYPMQREILAVK